MWDEELYILYFFNIYFIYKFKNLNKKNRGFIGDWILVVGSDDYCFI